MAGSIGVPSNGFGYASINSPDVRTPMKARTVSDSPSVATSVIQSPTGNRVSSPAKYLGNLSGSLSVTNLRSARSCYVHARPAQTAQEQSGKVHVRPALAAQEQTGNASKGSSANVRTPSCPASEASLRVPSVPAFPRAAKLSTVSIDSGTSAKVPANKQTSQDDLRGNEKCNESTAASSICESQHDNAESVTKVIFAKASELIRIEIAAVERRMTARVEAERAERKKACDKMASDLEAMVTIVERLSTQTERHSVDVMLEEERHLRDMVCASLHGKIETLASQLRSLSSMQNVVSVKEDTVDILYNHERGARNALERIAEDGSPSDPLSSKSDGVDEQYLSSLLDKESKERDVALATLRKEFRLEMEAMAMDVRSMAVRVPLFDAMEKQQKELEGMFTKLRDDIQASTTRDRSLAKGGDLNDQKLAEKPNLQSQASVVRDAKNRGVQ